MITPPPVIITQESGRVFEFVLGRMEVPPKEGDEASEAPPSQVPASQAKTEPEPEKIFLLTILLIKHLAKQHQDM